MAEDGALNAATIGAAATHDPQLRVPVWPRLRRGLHLEFTEDGLVVLGTPRRQTLKGRSATDLLPKLVDLLDGQHSHEELSQKLHVSVDTVFKALTLLWTAGIVEDLPAEDVAVPGHLPERVADYLSRIGDATGVNAAWEEAAQRLTTANVELFGAGVLPGMVRSELEPALPVTIAEGTVPHPDTTLAVWLDDGRTDGGPLTTHCWGAGVPLLRIRRHGRTVELGPYVDPRFTACLDCRSTADADDGRARSDLDDALAAALIAHDLFALVSRTSQGLLPQFWRRTDLETLEQHRLSSATRPGCPRCSVADGEIASAPPPVRYEAAIALPPKEFADLKAHQAHYKPSNLAIQRVQRDWPLSPELRLPQPRHTVLDRPWPSLTGPPERGDAPPLDADVVSVLLSVVAGFQGEDAERVWRWTPSGGNIGSVVAYPVIRDVPGIPSGVYGYQPSRNQLALIRSSVEGIGGEAPITLVLVGDFTKVAQKYGDAALRLCLLDSGCAQSAAHHVSAALGLTTSIHPDWDDHRVAEILHINPNHDVITAVLSIRAGE
ncbi:hypothetical protein J4H86_14900 [Spiractinospora alimapuensis]|uniref:hypothetical protein n=1 Tax=Spiractinospora alimapuensis TaxID=2820884 RepID=UPI001F43548C|nr:hypothetical protein [Spiractinospora alimapuensis]QVQ50238.1 hypothetical protein J4H86_14900 [Spiractinospora alimapuensis]